jgi:hypothetical protein
MLSARRFALPALLALGVLAGGGGLLAQMEAGERGILPIDSSGTLEIGGIHVDVGGKDAAAARYAGWRIAQREGFKALWAKAQGRPVGEAPTLADATLDGLVSSIIIEREQIGPNRYIADLGILFDRARAGQLLGVGGPGRRSAPMLLIPLMTSGGAQTSVELRNPWQRAWAGFRTAQSPVDYVRVSGMGADPLLVNAAQVRRPGRSWWRNILDFYGAANVLVAEVSLHRLYPGGPARATFVGSFGPDRQLLGSFQLTAKDSADLPRMMNEGVAKMDQLFASALAAGIIRGDPSLIIQPPPPVEEESEQPEPRATGPASVVQLLLAAPDGAALSAGIAQIRSISGVDAVTERSLAIGGTSSLLVTYRGDVSALRAALLARGWSVDYSGGMLRAARGPAPSAPAPAPSPTPALPPPAAPGQAQ